MSSMCRDHSSSRLLINRLNSSSKPSSLHKRCRRTSRAVFPSQGLWPVSNPFRSCFLATRVFKTAQSGFQTVSWSNVQPLRLISLMFAPFARMAKPDCCEERSVPIDISCVIFIRCHVVLTNYEVEGCSPALTDWTPQLSRNTNFTLQRAPGR